MQTGGWCVVFGMKAWWFYDSQRGYEKGARDLRESILQCQQSQELTWLEGSISFLFKDRWRILLITGELTTLWEGHADRPTYPLKHGRKKQRRVSLSNQLLVRPWGMSRSRTGHLPFTPLESPFVLRRFKRHPDFAAPLFCFLWHAAIGERPLWSELYSVLMGAGGMWDYHWFLVVHREVNPPMEAS